MKNFELNLLIKKYNNLLAKGKTNEKFLKEEPRKLEVQRKLNWAWDLILKDLHQLADKVSYDPKTRQH